MPRDFSILVCAPFNRRRRHHLHRRGDLLDVTDGLHALRDDLQRHRTRSARGEPVRTGWGVTGQRARACEASVRSREAPRAASVASSRGKSREQGFARGREGERLKRHARHGGARHIGAAQRPEQRGRALESVRSHRRTPNPRGFAARRSRARICLVRMRVRSRCSLGWRAEDFCVTGTLADCDYLV